MEPTQHLLLTNPNSQDGALFLTLLDINEKAKNYVEEETKNLNIAELLA